MFSMDSTLAGPSRRSIASLPPEIVGAILDDVFHSLYEDKRRWLVSGIAADSWCNEPRCRRKKGPPVKDPHDSFDGLLWPACCFTSTKGVRSYMNAYSEWSEEVSSRCLLFVGRRRSH